MDSIDNDVVVNTNDLLNDVIRQNDLVSFDQVAVIAMKDGEFAIWSTHHPAEMENMIDDALDCLSDGDIMDPVENEDAE